jgi:predicted phosphodiesterase
METEKVLVFGDLHAPYHNLVAFELMLKVAESFKPDYVINLGDHSDFYAATHYLKDPKREPLLAKELILSKLCARRIDAACRSAHTKVFCEGNHENRLERQIFEKVPWLHGIIPNADELIGWSKMGWKYVGYGNFAQIGKVVYTHDVGSASVDRASADAQTSIVLGHHHCQKYIVTGSVKGSPRLAFCPGWLGDASKADYMHRLQANRLWAAGFATGRMLENGVTVFSPVPIIGRTCVVEGRVFSV